VCGNEIDLDPRDTLHFQCHLLGNPHICKYVSKSHLIHTNVIPAPRWLTQRYSLCYYGCSLFKSKTSVMYHSAFVIFLMLYIQVLAYYSEKHMTFSFKIPFYSPLMNNQASHSICRGSTDVLRYIELKSFSTTSTAAISQRWALGKALS
jgi:hypothetical protein